jgi:hypothetical protein
MAATAPSQEGAAASNVASVAAASARNLVCPIDRQGVT